MGRGCDVFGLSDHEPETGEPVVTMTKLEYVLTWAVIGMIALALARWVLVAPILHALARLAK